MLSLLPKNNLRPALRIKQILAPKIIQMLKLFNYSYQDLHEELLKESKSNVFIEIVKDDNLINRPLQTKTSLNTDFDNKRSWENLALDNVTSLRGFLLSQLKLLSLKDKDEEIAQYLIDQIDERGYLSNYLEAKEALIKNFGVDDRKIKSILTIIQSFEPDGVGARDLKECLLIQINEYNFESTALKELLSSVIKYHLNDLAENNYEEIAENFKITSKGVSEIQNFIKANLNPNPGAGFSKSSLSNFIVPSFQVQVRKEEITINNLEKDKGLKVVLSSDYLNMLEDSKLDEKTRDYLLERYLRAKELVDNLNKRYENLEKVVNALISKQHNFFSKGPDYLEPLLQKDFATELNISTSTLSRIISSKYIETPNGIFLLKSLCPRSYFGKTKSKILLIITNKFSDFPKYSDQKISELLAEDGLFIARRTIAKYRRLSNIKSKFYR